MIDIAKVVIINYNSKINIKINDNSFRISKYFIRFLLQFENSYLNHFLLLLHILIYLREMAHIFLLIVIQQIEIDKFLLQLQDFLLLLHLLSNLILIKKEKKLY